METLQSVGSEEQFFDSQVADYALKGAREGGVGGDRGAAERAADGTSSMRGSICLGQSS